MPTPKSWYEAAKQALDRDRPSGASTEPRLRVSERHAAENILNRRYADPDDDAAIVARAALRLGAGAASTEAPTHADFELKQCDECFAMHESAKLTRFCPACGSENHTVRIGAGAASTEATERPDPILEALRDEQRYAGALSDALLRMGHHPFGHHEAPYQYDADSFRACSFDKCLAALTGAISPSEPSGVCDHGVPARYCPAPESHRAAPEEERAR